jgi:hypothetical protein
MPDMLVETDHDNNRAWSVPQKQQVGRIQGTCAHGEDDVGACTLPYALIVRSATTKFSPLPILTSNEMLPGLTIVQCTTATPAAFVFTALVVPHAMLYAGFG